MHCLISVVMRDWTAVHEEAQRYKRKILEAASPRGVERPPVFRASKGLVLLVDWDGQRLIGGLELPKPTGLLSEGERLNVALWDHDEVATLDCTGPQPRVIRHIRHRWFNHIHTIDPTPRGLLLSSSGSDLLVEVDDRGALLWSAFLFEHGYGGRRHGLGSSFDPALDYNRRYLPAALTAHPNSALLRDPDHVLATLFSTGELVEIDRRRGEVRVCLDGLSRPHSLRRRAEGGYVLSDSEARRVVLLDDALRPCGEIAVDLPWIQDAVLAEERLFVVGNRKLATHALTQSASASEGDNAVLELREGMIERRLAFGPDSRIYMVEPLDAARAAPLVPAFAASALDLGWLRWEGAA